jgi:hypothetical protein
MSPETTSVLRQSIGAILGGLVSEIIGFSDRGQKKGEREKIGALSRIKRSC